MTRSCSCGNGPGLRSGLASARGSALLVLLAGELYRRERGGPPPSDEALVGPYLSRLPDDGAADLDDGTTPTVEDPQITVSEAGGKRDGTK